MKAAPHLLFLRPSLIRLAKSPPPCLRLLSPTSLSQPNPKQQQTRQFVSNPLAPEVQSLNASRTLSHHASDLYALIADILSYPKFIPYCTSSTITKWSSRDPSGKSWPQEASLRIGWAGYDEVFSSKIFCVPNTVIEAVAGEARTSLPKDDIPHHISAAAPSSSSSSGQDQQFVKGNELFTSLLTRWTLREFPYKPLPPDGSSPQEGSASLPSKPQTEVNLVIEVQFANAMYAALSKAAAPKVAGMMIEAFEKRARETLGEGHGGAADEGMQSTGRGETREGQLDGLIKR